VDNKTIIVGGGISGLAAAYYLSKAGGRATLVEKDSKLGGVIRTDHMYGCVIEGGPDGFMAAKPWASELIREVGLGDQVIGSNDHSRVTYILKNGKLIPMPDGLMMMVPTKIMPLVGTPLLSWGCKIRMGLEFFRRPNGQHEDRSVYAFLMDHYGEEAIDYLAEPLLAGVYGGDPKQLSVNSVLARFVELETKYGSLSRGVLAAPKPKGSGSGASFLNTLKNGLGELIEKLRPSADVVQGTVQALERDGSGYRLNIDGAWAEADQVIIATPAYEAAKLVRPIDPRLGEVLDQTPYTSSVTMALGYKKDTFDHPIKGHGFLVPKRERKYLMGCTWVNNKFDHRAPDDIVLLRCFMGGNAVGESDEALVEIARGELRRIMGLQAEPFFYRVSRWPSAMAQFAVGHEKRVAEIEALTADLPGLHLIGNAYKGIGVPDCIRMGRDAARKAAGIRTPAPAVPTAG
jgi:oxygen-dependent protoporphyrinogen oxidase